MNPRIYRFLVILLIILMGLAGIVFFNSVKQLSDIPNPFSRTATPTETTLPTLTATQRTLVRPAIITPQVYVDPPWIHSTQVCQNNSGVVTCLWVYSTYTPTLTATATATVTSTPTATLTPIPTTTPTPKPYTIPVITAGGSLGMLIVCFILLMVILTGVTRRRSQGSEPR
jgi:hypothetical protein